MARPPRDGYIAYSEDEYRDLLQGAPKMAVRSYEPRDDSPQRRPPERGEPPKKARGWSPRQRAGAFCLGLLAVMMAAPGWVRGARYTVDGWRILAQALLDIVGAPLRLGAPTGWLLFGLVVGAGLAYSVAETLAWPGRPWEGLIGFWALAVVAWLLVIGSDIGTTVIGVLNTPAAAWPAERWIATRPPAAGIYALVLTFYPEAFTVGGIWLIARAIR